MGKRKPKALSSNESTYIYSSLLSPSTSIRLLRLLPFTDQSFPLRCILFTTTLSTAPPYTALSYTWGDARRTSSIHVSSSSSSDQAQAGYLSITYNLKHFLQRIRSSSIELVLWADSICINQSDISERSIQTTRMREIYQHASSVAIWLGLAYGGSHGAIGIVRELNSCTTAEAAQGIVENSSKKGDLEALVALFRRQYWWRVWVIQEVACAVQATVYVGNEGLSWSELESVCSVLKSAESDLHKIFFNRPSWVRTLTHGGPRSLQLSRYDPEVKAPPLLEALLTHKSKNATDPRDKVIAILGISASRETFGPVDYAKDVSEVFVHTARHIIEVSRKLDVICVKHHNDVRVMGLPSWVPDWTRPKFGHGATVLGLHHRTPAFRAAGETEALVDFVARGDKLVLKVEGIVLGRISATGRSYKKQGSPSYIGPAIGAFNSWWSLFKAQLTGDPSVADQIRFAHLISCGTWTSQPIEEVVERMAAIFALSNARLGSTETISQFGPSSRTSTTSSIASSIASSSSSRQDQEENEDDEDDMAYMLSEVDKERLSAIIAAGLTMNCRRMIICSNGTMGLAPWNAREDDIVVVLLGCRCPVVLKSCDAGSFVLRGEAYVEGYMDGEVLEALKHSTLMIEEFEIQ